MADLRKINEYLFYEFGYDEQYNPVSVAEDFPLVLEMIGSIYLGSDYDEIEVFQFTFEDVAYFALSGATITVYPTAGMTAEDLYLQYLGASWIAERDPIDLLALRSADGGISSTTQQWAIIEEISSLVCQSPRILEALYLRQTGDYLVLVEDHQAQTAWVIGDKLKPQATAFPQASTERRLALGMGVVLTKAELFQTGPIKVTVRWIFRAIPFVLMLLWAYPIFIIWQDTGVIEINIFTFMFATSCLLAFLLFNSIELTPEAIAWKTLLRTRTNKMGRNPIC